MAKRVFYTQEHGRSSRERHVFFNDLEAHDWLSCLEDIQVWEEGWDGNEYRIDGATEWYDGLLPGDPSYNEAMRKASNAIVAACRDAFDDGRQFAQDNPQRAAPVARVLNVDNGVVILVRETRDLQKSLTGGDYTHWVCVRRDGEDVVIEELCSCELPITLMEPRRFRAHGVSVDCLQTHAHTVMSGLMEEV